MTIPRAQTHHLILRKTSLQKIVAIPVRNVVSFLSQNAFRLVGCLRDWKQLEDIQLLVVFWLILTLFFLFVKYDRIRVSELLEKPYAFSLLVSRGGYSESNAFDMSVDKTPTTFLLSTACFHLSINRIREASQFWYFRYAVRLLLNIGSINDVSCLLSNYSKTFPITVKNPAKKNHQSENGSNQTRKKVLRAKYRCLKVPFFFSEG